jgi:hypothetical protein
MAKKASKWLKQLGGWNGALVRSNKARYFMRLALTNTWHEF